jgi:hypothetical protein
VIFSNKVGSERESGEQAERGSITISLPIVNKRALSLAFLKAPSISSSGFQTRGTPCSSYRNRSSKWPRNLPNMTVSAVCSSILARSATQARLRNAAIEVLFSSSVQLKPIGEMNDNSSETPSLRTLGLCQVGRLRFVQCLPERPQHIVPHVW